MRRLWPHGAALIAIAMLATAFVALVPAAPDAAGAVGDYHLDFAASHPDLYDHSTGGGYFGDNVESLEGGDFACGDIVSYLLEITVDGEPSDDPETIQLVHTLDSETTSGGLVGFVSVVAVTIDNSDPTQDHDGGSVIADLTSTVNADHIELSYTVSDLETDETVVVRIDAELGCAEADVTGNIQARLDSANVVGGGTIPGGAQTVPLKAAGDVVQETQVTLRKVWNDGAADGDTADLAMSYGPSTAPTDSTTGQSVAGDPVTEITLVVPAGETVSMSELLAAGNERLYSTSFACTGATNDPAVSDPNQSATLLIDADDTSVVCTFTNAARAASVTFVKEWSGPEVLADTTTLQIDTADVQQTSPTAHLPMVSATVPLGATVTISELLTAGNVAGYTAEFRCVNAQDDPIDVTGIGDYSASFAADETEIRCIVTNTRKSATFSLGKLWAGSIPGDTAELTASGSADDSGTANVDIDFTSVAPTDSTDSMVIWAGETVSYSENLSADRYDVSHRCGTAAAQAGTEGTYVVPADPTDVVCEFTNDVFETSITLRKEWVDARSGDQATLFLTPDGAVPTTALSTAGDGVDTVSVATATVQAETQVFFHEELDKAENYSTSFDCVGAEAEPVSTLTRAGWSLDVGAADAGAEIICTITNTRRSTALLLAKAWGPNSVPGDSVTLSIEPDPTSGDSTAAGASTYGPDPIGTDSFASIVVFAGDTIGLAEGHDPDNAAHYDVSALTCTAGDLDWVAGATEGSLVLDAEDVSLDMIECEFVNTRKSAQLTLDKAWVGDLEGLTVDLRVDDGIDSIETEATSPAGPDPATNTMTIYSGEILQLSEEFRADGAADFSQALACDQDGLGASTYTVPLDPSDVACTFTNTFVDRPATIFISKFVENDDGGTAAATDWTLYVDGVAVPTTLMDDPPDGYDSAAVGSVSVAAGHHTFGEGDGPRGYVNTRVECTTGDGVIVGVTEIEVGRGETADCFFVNDDAQLTVDKQSLGPDEGVGWYDNDLSGGISAGDDLAFVIVGTNSGDVTLTNVVLSDPQAGSDTMDCGDMAPGEECVWGSSDDPILLELSQADIDAKTVTNTAFGTSDQDDDQDDEEVNYDPAADMETVKVFTGCNPQASCEDGVQAGDVITFDITATNIGALTLLDVTVDDPLTGDTGVDALACSPALAPADSCTVSVEYVTTVADLAAGDVIENVATVSAMPDPGPGEEGDPIVRESTDQAPIQPEPRLTIDKSVTPTLINDAEPGDEANFVFVITNEGNITLGNVAVIDDMIEGDVTCDETTLDPGESTTCTADYSITTEDIANGSVDNVALATGSSTRLEEPVVSEPDDATVVFVVPEIAPVIPPAELPDPPTPTPEPEDEVLGITELAVTGTDSRRTAAGAVTLVLAGSWFVLGERRRRTGTNIG